MGHPVFYVAAIFGTGQELGKRLFSVIFLLLSVHKKADTYLSAVILFLKCFSVLVGEAEEERN